MKHLVLVALDLSLLEQVLHGGTQLPNTFAEARLQAAACEAHATRATRATQPDAAECSRACILLIRSCSSRLVPESGKFKSPRLNPCESSDFKFATCGLSSAKSSSTLVSSSQFVASPHVPQISCPKGKAR
jgi:hypothetical protein